VGPTFIVDHRVRGKARGEGFGVPSLVGLEMDLDRSGQMDSHADLLVSGRLVIILWPSSGPMELMYTMVYAGSAGQHVTPSALEDLCP
jgi:hypothetical protein